MKTRTALTIGVLGTAGAIGTYLYNKPTLRRKMLKADSAQEAASLFATEVEKDAADIAKTMKKKAMHNWLMDELRGTGAVIGGRLKAAKKHVKNDMKTVKRETKKTARDIQAEKGHIERKLKATAKKSAQTVADKVPAA